jgi:single-strand DNA-binding protein
MAANINRVVLVGNLTRDPELRHTPSGTPVCSLRVAVNDRKRDESGNWVDAPNYFSVSVFGNQAESCAQYLAKGRPVGIDGKLRWREWEAKDGGGKREAVEIVADSVQFLGSRGDGDDGGGGGNQFVPAGAAQESADFPAAADDDIPF